VPLARYCLPNSPLFLLLSQRKYAILLLAAKMSAAAVSESIKSKKDVQRGTLVLIVLKALDVLGPLHRYGVVRRMEQISGDLLFQSSPAGLSAIR
jgi:hypothetical protein